MLLLVFPTFDFISSPPVAPAGLISAALLRSFASILSHLFFFLHQLSSSLQQRSGERGHGHGVIVLHTLRGQSGQSEKAHHLLVGGITTHSQVSSDRRCLKFLITFFLTFSYFTEETD